MVSSSPEEFLQLIRDVDRKAFGVHLDLTNMINGIKRYNNREAFLDQCITLLGPYIKSIHMNDAALKKNYPA